MRGPSAEFFGRTRVVALHGLGSSIPGGGPAFHGARDGLLAHARETSYFFRKSEDGAEPPVGTP